MRMKQNLRLETWMQFTQNFEARSISKIIKHSSGKSWGGRDRARVVELVFLVFRVKMIEGEKKL